jgi:hypothetical protein
MDHYTTWIGYGVKAGFSSGFFGAETADGKVCNIGYTNDVYPLNISSLRVGQGLGAAVGVVAIVVFHCIDIKSLDNESMSDWSINFSLGGKWSAIAKGIKKRKFLGAIARTMGDLSKATPDDITKIRNTASYLYNAADVATMDANWKIVVIDIPGAGVGLEASVSDLHGTVFIGDLITPIEDDKTYNDGGASGAGPGT